MVKALDCRSDEDVRAGSHGQFFFLNDDGGASRSMRNRAQSASIEASTK